MGTFGCVLLETIDARDGSGRDRVYEGRLCFAAFSVCKAFTFTAQEEGGRKEVFYADVWCADATPQLRATRRSYCPRLGG